MDNTVTFIDILKLLILYASMNIPMLVVGYYAGSHIFKLKEWGVALTFVTLFALCVVLKNTLSLVQSLLDIQTLTTALEFIIPLISFSILAMGVINRKGLRSFLSTIFRVPHELGKRRHSYFIYNETTGRCYKLVNGDWYIFDGTGKLHEISR